MALLPPDSRRRMLAGAFLTALAAITSAQDDPLTLQEALQRAVERNGNVQAAVASVEAAESRVRQAQSEFLPTLSPNLRYSDQRRDIFTGGRGFFVDSGTQVDLTANWQLLDSGERRLSLNSTRSSFEAEEFSALQTLRSTLFTVHQQYFEVLRAQELLKIAEAQVARAEEILRQTDALIGAEQIPRKDRLQAQADLQNARVQLLQARNGVATTEAELKASIAWDPRDPLPELQEFSEPEAPEALPPLEDVAAQGIQQRPDLQAQRKRIQAQEFGVRRTERFAGLQFSLDVSAQHAFSPDVFNSRGLTISATYPLFDGARSREAVREAKLQLEASRDVLMQTEFQAHAEIESAYLSLGQNAERVQAAELALQAARENYQAAQEAYSAGALGTNIVTVQTALVSLVTAESNYIEAIYDYYISEVRLRLATGQPILGEGL